MPDSSPVQRQWQILIMLMSRRNGVTVAELSQEVGVNTRTINRDISILRKLDFPLEERVSEHGRKHWSVSPGGAKVPIHFSWPEAVALYLGRRLLDPLAGTYIWHSAHSAFQKIRAMLGEPALEQLEKVSKSFLQTIAGRSDYGEKAELIDLLMLAIEDRKIAFVAYQSERATEPVSLEMYPYGIVYHKTSLYLVAFSRDHDSIRHFKIDRVFGVDVQNLQFTPDKNFNLETHFANSFGVFRSNNHDAVGPQTIRIRFASEAAKYVEEKIWHPSQRITKEKTGSLILEVSLSDTHELKSWVLSFGPRATVLEPQSLRKEIQQDLETSLAEYQSRSVNHRTQKPKPNRTPQSNQSKKEQKPGGRPKSR